MPAQHKLSTKVVNLKEGMPFVREALSHMELELRRASKEGVQLLKFVHGYGSTGKGGEIRIAVQKALMKRLHQHELKAVIFGENWRISDEATWELCKNWPELKKDCDIGRDNRGITVVVL
ncbi:MAG TPA: hypothetical protein VN577_19290 [Terriglobales bacterium]|nr:hypothetical protein [Terriglobales bacterium]